MFNYNTGKNIKINTIIMLRFPHKHIYSLLFINCKLIFAFINNNKNNSSNRKIKDSHHKNNQNNQKTSLSFTHDRCSLSQFQNTSTF